MPRKISLDVVTRKAFSDACYNRLFNKLPTIAQQPDNVIQFASDERFYIFDAKYRIHSTTSMSNTTAVLDRLKKM
jgi:hypothetical protein